MKKKNPVSRIITGVFIAAIIALVLYLGIELVIELNNNKITKEITAEEMQQIVDKDIRSLPATTAYGTKEILKNFSIKVNSLDYGIEKDVVLKCSYSTVNVKDVMTKEALHNVLCNVYGYYIEKNGKVNATAIQIAFEESMINLINMGAVVEGEIEVRVYEMNDGSYKTYLSDEIVNTLLGGLLSVKDELADIEEIDYKGEKIDIKNLNTLRTGIQNIIGLSNYDSSKPNTSGWLLSWISDFAYDFNRNFIEKDMWMFITNGLLTTLELTGASLLFGVLLGLLVATVRVTYNKTGSLPILNAICKAYLSVIRGTPIMVQLLIIYFVLLAPLDVNKFLSAVICFGINSGAYVAEIIRGGIESVDGGQNEAGRSLGLNYFQTMVYIIIPQAFKNVLPSLANEFITLLKETSVAFYIGVADLTQAGLRIRSITFSNYMPLVAVAFVYFILVVILTKLVGILEKKLKQSER